MRNYQLNRFCDVFKPGDKVKIKNLKWLTENCTRYRISRSDIGEQEEEWEFEFNGTNIIVSTQMLKFCGKEATIIAELNTGSDVFALDIDGGLFSWNSILLELVDNFKKSREFSSSLDDYSFVKFGEFCLGICKPTGIAIPEFFTSQEEIKSFIIENYGREHLNT